MLLPLLYYYDLFAFKYLPREKKLFWQTQFFEEIEPLVAAVLGEWTTDMFPLHCYFGLFLWNEVGRQHLMKLQAADISPYLTSPTLPNPPDRPQHRGTLDSLDRTVCGFFNVPRRLRTLNVCETESMVLSPYPRRLEDVITKAALSRQLFLKTLSVILSQ